MEVLNLDLPPMSEIINSQRKNAELVLAEARHREALAIAERAELRQAETLMIVERERRFELEQSRLRQASRSYAAAKSTRLNPGFSIARTSARTAIWRSLSRLRARSRVLARDNDLMKRFLSMLRNNVAGPKGMTLQCTSPNDSYNEAVEKAWTVWSHKENASINRQISWTSAQRRWITTLARDGEVMVRLMVANNPFGFAIKFIDVNWLDETFNEKRGNNRIIMSVELDPDDQPVAYWLTPPADEFSFAGGPRDRTRTRVPAEEIIHTFLRDDENTGDDSQTRGVPWAHTAMNSLYQLGVFSEAAIVAAANGALRMGFLKRPIDDFNETDSSEETEIPQIDHLEAGEVKVLPDGYEYQESASAYPHPVYEPFTKAMKRDAASGLDVSYNSLANDGEGINYSTMRQFILEDRRGYSSLHWMMIECFERPVHLAWLRTSILSGAVKIKASDFPFFTEPNFVPPGFDWVDPLKDVQATVLEINNGLGTITDAIAQRGGDIKEVFTKRQKELQLAEEMEIPLAKPTDSKPESDDPEEEDPNAAKAKKKKPPTE